MRRGDFAGAWVVSDAELRARLARGESSWHLPRHLQPVWNGTPLADRRVLVRCYHGLGDTIQFIRLAAPLRHIARSVTLWVQPALMALVSGAAGIDRVLPLHDGGLAPTQCDCDVDIEIMELAHALRLDLASIPAQVPYLFPPDPPPPPSRGERLRVGIVWQAGDWDGRRSVPAPLLASLTGIDGIALGSLQRGPARRDAAALGLPDISHAGIAETARRLMQLDLVISVDSMIAHLAGALGRRVWTLLPAEADWRWMEARHDSPWYPTMHLIRQPRPGDWNTVIARVCRALRRAGAGATGNKPFVLAFGQTGRRRGAASQRDTGADGGSAA